MLKKPCAPQIGADVEAFLYNSESCLYEPCVGMLPGTKEKPHPLPDMKAGFAVQEDNVMVEFNIPPATIYTRFADNMYRAIRGVQKLLKSKYPDKQYTLGFVDSVQFAAKDLKSEQACTIGCEPDFDAYQGGEVRTNFPTLDRWRGAGGHIHLGGDFQCPDFVAALFADAVIGLSGNIVGLTPSKRADWYGRPGIFRPKPYGIEYRSPSSAWAGSKENTMVVGSLANRLATWLTETDAKELQSVFRKVNWADVRSALVWTDMPVAERAEFRSNVINQCQKAGLPI